MRWVLLAACVLAGSITSTQSPQRREFRALWVDTFNTPLNTHADIVRVVDGARNARFNVILAQVRRRGDAWYLDSFEPPPDFVPIQAGFDPLADLIATAHTFGIQVHAFVIIGAIWNKDPALPRPANGPPLDDRHVFNQHGGFDSARGTIDHTRDTWLTRTLLPDGAATSYQGHRIGLEFWLDFGHPDAAAYTVDVLAHLVRRYDVDGLHLDRIRYPELSVAGQTPTTGANIGYNAVSLERFQRHHQLSNTVIPTPGDQRWAEWRRMQVSNLVRRIYLTVAAIKPTITVSAALIAFGGVATIDDAWRGSEAYWRVYQDWHGWLEEGVLDLAMPMIYRREHDVTQSRQFDDWLTWVKPRQHGRAILIGLGVFLNGVEGTLRQVRRSLASGPAGAAPAGVAFYSFANPSEAVVANPWSMPPGQSTPRRDFIELASAVTTGHSVDGRVDYEDRWRVGLPVFAEAVSVPTLAWKQAPRLGHLMGIATDTTGVPFDTMRVEVVDVQSGRVRSTITDGHGFFGAVDLDPGVYVISLAAAGVDLRGMATVVAGRVTNVSLR